MTMETLSNVPRSASVFHALFYYITVFYSFLQHV